MNAAPRSNDDQKGPEMALAVRFRLERSKAFRRVPRADRLTMQAWIERTYCWHRQIFNRRIVLDGRMLRRRNPRRSDCHLLHPAGPGVYLWCSGVRRSGRLNRHRGQNEESSTTCTVGHTAAPCQKWEAGHEICVSRILRATAPEASDDIERMHRPRAVSKTMTEAAGRHRFFRPRRRGPK